MALLLLLLAFLGGDFSEGLALGPGPREVELSHCFGDGVEDSEDPALTQPVQLDSLAQNTPQDERLKNIFV